MQNNVISLLSLNCDVCDYVEAYLCVNFGRGCMKITYSFVKHLLGRYATNS
jgi:hypothetical protein